ncbi:hypothetical protein Salat_2689900 [Sesamum alatum]|uniref:DUF4283 domain-containing protein n=1 Tax=Sesamum alatum TaxID=300844 RepID=A0AAE1XPS7_9LAMI|nr:hypothetical protein Salat_2689900 [Sesamum alatum]
MRVALGPPTRLARPLVACFGYGGFFVVGRLIASKSFHPEAVHTTLKSAFNPVRGMEFKMIEGEWFLLKLRECEFYVHIHGLPLGEMMKEIASFIGNKLGHFKKRALKIRTVLGDEQLISFTYERLPNFCRRLGHLSRLCELQFQEGFCDPGDNPPFGNSL